MKTTELYRIISSDETAVSFLREHHLLPDGNNLPPCSRCGEEVRETTRKKRLADGTDREYKTLRCVRKGCQTFQSIRKTNKFFTFTDLNDRCNSHLSLGQILELAYFWAYQVSQATVRIFTGRGDHTIIDWFNLCRDVCCELFALRQPMGGPLQRIEIDECLLRGKRKYNRGRMLLGNQPAEQ